VSDLTPPAPAAAAGPRWLKIGFFLSVAVNLLILGAVAGTMIGMRHGPPRYTGGRGEDFGLMGITRTMPAERRKEFRKEIAADRRELHPLMDEAREARRAAADKLAADPFDRAALEAAIANVTEKERTLRNTALQSFLTRVEALTPDERRQLADAWRRRSEVRWRARTKKDGAGKDDKTSAGAASPRQP